MDDRKTEEFLDLYRRLETAAEKLVGSESRSSAVMRLVHQRGFSQYRDMLDMCREVRNLLSHEPKLGGSYVFSPSDALLEQLRVLVDRAEHPLTVADKMTDIAHLVVTWPDAPALPLMERMRKNNISHIPLLKNGRVNGIFSVGTVFQALLDGAVDLGPETKISDFADYLPLERHMGQSFQFAARSMTLAQAGDLFDKAYDRKRKIKLLLVTEHGKQQESLLGVVTPYDLLDRDAEG